MVEKKDHCLVKANNFDFDFNKEEIAKLDIVKKDSSSYHMIHNGRSSIVHVLSGDHKKLKVEMEGEVFEIEIRDRLDQMLDKMGFSEVSNRHIKEIKAPMPGLVLEVSVEEGQAVLEGDKILILEAMKMENSIMISANATIKRILIKAGQPVDKGQVLVELD